MLKTLFALVVAGLLAAVGYAAWYATTPVAVGKLPAEFEILPGMRLRAAARVIEDSGVAVGRLRFELLARALGRAEGVKAGSYELASAPTPLELLDKLTRGDVTQAELRFIEGWTFRQLRAALDASAFVRHDAQGLGDAQLLQKIGAREAQPEGLFFPDTYLFSKGTSDLRVLRRAYLAMQRHLASEWEAREPSVPYKTPYEALIMASIVEKETGQAAEREMIAGALVNRLRAGMLLQVDPTVIYGLGESFDGTLRKIHLQTDGPYNTYTRAGLPPTPIAAPGLASLHAALRPAKTSVLYYVSRGDGSSEFSRTLEEHNRAVRKYQLNAGRK
ncbi:MAG TPA: endolytic transglycosylase MltG [Burkholderiales bacterium]|nr:endolytic transglycosylase MltG [Burkholderiales bacterium]